jgi:hypothetical protein
VGGRLGNAQALLVAALPWSPVARIRQPNRALLLEGTSRKTLTKSMLNQSQALNKYVSSDAKRLSGQRTQTAPAQSQIRGFPFIGSINSPMVSFAVPSVAFEGEEWVVFLPFVHHVHGRTTE